MRALAWNAAGVLEYQEWHRSHPPRALRRAVPVKPKEGIRYFGQQAVLGALTATRFPM
jgi:hypothetical protein